MKVLLVGFLQSIGGWLAMSALVSWIMQAYLGAGFTDTIGISLFIGGFTWVAMGLFNAAFGRMRERAAILSGAGARPPLDGRHTVLVGKILPIGAPLIAPMDGSACVMYSYEVIYDAGTGKRRSAGTIARGVGLTACRIVTASGDHKLLAVPKITGFPPGNSSAERLERFNTYRRRTTFTTTNTSARELVQQWEDSDGIYRSDVAHESLESSDSRYWTLNQQHVPAGAMVCVFGPYSKAKGGIVPASTAPVRVEVGSAQEIAESLRRQATTWSIIGLGILAVPVVVVLANL